ncbi:hypothetical protein C2E31_19320 [Rhodopirellula baltica]|nr:hypothetical protein C2E31_19320 [Rhodopirellula baltica]
MLSFSIITPTLARRRFLVETLESVTYSDAALQVEHLIVTSPDAGDSPLKFDLGDSHVTRSILETPVCGAAAAFNHGMLQAQGDIIGCLADDDTYLPETLSRVQGIFESNPDAEIIYGAIDQIDEDNVTYRTRVPRLINQRRILRKAPNLQPSLFFRRSLLERTGNLDESLQYHFWYEFALRAFRAGHRFVRTEDSLGCKRRHRENTHFGNAVISDRVAAAQERIELLHKHLGMVPAPAALELGQVLALQQGFEPLAKGYDRAVLRLASQAIKPLGGSRNLYLTHAKHQSVRALKYPRELTRYMPKAVAVGVRGFFRSRLFQLKQHEPRAVKNQKQLVGESASKQLSIGMVTPNLNTAEYLQRTIESVVNQNFPRLQYVVQDGESTDNSVDIIRQFESQLHCWESRRDGGQTQAINRGLSHVDTDIMAYLNSDDILLPGSLSFVSEYFRKIPAWM